MNDISVEEIKAAGRHLAQLHAIEAAPVHDRSLIGFAESDRPGDWTLRSALVRLAQPEPQRAGVVLELIRRCDAALRPLAKSVEKHGVVSEPHLSIAGLITTSRHGAAAASSTKAEATSEAGGRIDGRIDARAADLARLARDDPERFPTLLSAYRDVVELDDEEVAAIPLLELALALDELADHLASWAAEPILGAPPNDVVDAISAATFERMDQLGVATEERPPGSARGQRSG